MVDALVDQANASAPKQVSIESKFVESTKTMPKNSASIGCSARLA